MNYRKLLLVLCVFPIFVIAQSGDKADLTAALDQLVQQQRNSHDIPGLAIGLIIDNEIVFAKGVGQQSLDGDDPLTTQSLFHMASVSKPFVATAAMQLVEANKLELDELLTTYLPYYKMADKRYRKITIRQLLTHTSGIPDVEDYDWGNPTMDDGAAERYAKSFVTSPLDFKPGKDYNYSNAAYDIMAAVISKVSGMTFEEYMKQRIFIPAGMKHTTFFQPEVPAGLATAPHVVNNRLAVVTRAVYPYNRIHAPSSTLHSNVEDMLRWAQVQLNGGRIDGQQLYSPASYRALTTIQRELGDSWGICHGWFSSDFNGLQKLSHSGGDPGYRTYFAFLPERKAAIVMMGNSDLFPSSAAANFILNRVLFGEEEAWKRPISIELSKYILTEGIEKVKEVYYAKQAKEADRYYFENGQLDDLGYELLERNHLQEALDIFLFQVALFPEEAGWHDSVGDGYQALGNTAKAIEWYRKALAIDPKFDLSKGKLKALLKQQ
ncbi:MAG: serine hydrolase [Bacteroidota bacterium]